MKNKEILKLLLSSIICILFLILNFINKSKLIFFIYRNYRLSKFSNNFQKENEIFFNLTNLLYFYNNKYNLVQINYNIVFLDKYNNIIKPSDLTLFYKLQIICHIKLKNTKIDSLAYVFHNKEYKCKEFISIKQKAKFGIKIYLENNKSFTTYFFSDKIINYNKRRESEKLNPLLINIEYQKLIEKIKNNKDNSLNLKKLYINLPSYLKKDNFIYKNNIWYFRNIYNNYFCFCKGSCFYLNISQKCKYLFYLNIIDNNKNLYNKTDYLFSDFYFADKSSDDTYPIFTEMIKQNISAHYMDEKGYLYEKFCNKQKNCLKIIPVINKNINIDGDFLEKYLDLILKLKAVITGDHFYSYNNIFYNIDYITLII